MLKFYYILLFIVVLFNTTLFSQVQQEWIQRYNGSSNSYDEGICSTIDKNGNLIVCGASINGNNFRDYIIIKYNSNGIILWNQQYNGPGNSDDVVISVKTDVLNNIYVTGRSRGIGSGEDYCTIKYSSDGIVQWNQRYNYSGDDIPNSLVVDTLGNVYITGDSRTGFGYSTEMATIKYNSLGVLQWVRRNGSFGWDIALDHDNNVLVTGFSDDIFTGGDIITIKYDNQGNGQWVKTFTSEENNNEEARSIAIDNLNNVYVSGYIYDTATGPNYIIIKYNSNGDQQWFHTYNGPGNYYDWALKVAVDNLNNVYITGFIAVLNPLSYDIATIKYNSSGVEQWVRTYNGPNNRSDNANSLALDNLGNIYVAGWNNDSTNLSDFVTIMYDPEGNEQWVQRYNGPIDSTDQLFSIAVANANNIYVTGTSRGIGSVNDIVTIKYTQPIGITLISNEQPYTYKLEQNYPNPFNPQTIIHFQVLAKGDVKLVVFDILGREIETLMNQNLEAGYYKVLWDGSKLPSGIYYYTIKTEKFSASKKMVLLK